MTKTKKTLFLADPGKGYWNGVDRLVAPAVGNWLEPDGWLGAGGSGSGGLLEESDWSAADYRIKGFSTNTSYAINLEITGRDIKYGPGGRGDGWLRVRIVWVGDGKPDTFSGGWLKTDGYKDPE